MDVESVLAWVQFGAIVAGASAGVQAIRTTTRSLAAEIHKLSAVIELMDGRIHKLELARAREEGRREALSEEQIA